ncbi:MAG: peroxide stress protein YaaA [Chitinophagales bacterium]|nr:peroxide stress protein YaaA [Chitinophagales bacterium]MCZ2394594.1 peroxide stress protein YaaA [Chitinophagales bacterium]
MSSKMHFVLSPAKSLDWNSKFIAHQPTQPQWIAQAEILVDTLKVKTEEDIRQLMGISPNLARLNMDRYQSWSVNHSQNTRPAIYAFNGDVYVGLDAYTMDKKNIQFAQNHLRILSGLYGMLRPLDLIYPYRLEMGTSLAVENNKNLYQFWSHRVTTQLNKELGRSDYLINLASEEYFKVIETKSLMAQVITPVFYEYKNGQYKIISFYAKKARGLMARYIIDNQINSPELIKNFNSKDYSFSEPLSKDNQWAFVR